MEGSNVASRQNEDQDAIEEVPWAVRLFKKSPLKQKKLAKILKYLGAVKGQTCLDVGSDNGVISYFLRAKGGTWYSCDLIAETVASIKQLVEERVDQIDGEKTPYKTDQFDKVVIVDFLEHIRTDREFINELYRIIKSNGTLVINVPNPKRGILRRVRALLGQTDAAHGHLRPGYTLEELRDLLGEGFEIETQESYSRLFSVLTDTAITFALDILKKGSGSKKGTVVTGQDMQKLKKSFLLFSCIYPFVACLVKLDDLFPFLHGNMLIVQCKKERVDVPTAIVADDDRPSFIE
ncbi:class I SAM-dependent methyltransferase, partial [Oligoflexia bacterium]|nr:class I SAM-dependent methyltransferase [Oligoflexia bacterium]